MVNCVQIPKRKDLFHLHQGWERHYLRIRLAAGILANILHTLRSQFLFLHSTICEHLRYVRLRVDGNYL